MKAITVVKSSRNLDITRTSNGHISVLLDDSHTVGHTGQLASWPPPRRPVLGGILWPMTHLTHQWTDSWPTWPMTHELRAIIVAYRLNVIRRLYGEKFSVRSAPERLPRCCGCFEVNFSARQEKFTGSWIICDRYRASEITTLRQYMNTCFYS